MTTHRQTQIHSRDRNGRRYYYCYLNGRQRGLGYDSLAAAKESLRLLMGGTPDGASPTLAALAALFDEWGAEFTSPRTADDYAYWLRRLVLYVGPDWRATDLEPKHIDGFVSSENLVGTWAHIKVIRAARRVLRWAQDQGHIRYQRSPLAGLRLPPRPASPEVVLSNHQLWYMMRSGYFTNSFGVFKRSRVFGDVVRFGLRTGARPEEMRIIRVKWIDQSQRTIVIPWAFAKNGKRTKRDRIIRYPQSLARLVQRRVARATCGHLFETRWGKPFTPGTLESQFRYVERRQPDLFPDGCFSRSLRYTFTTRAILAGVGVVELAHLLGHVNTTTLMRHYQKLGVYGDHLRDAADRAARGPARNRSILS